MILHILEITSKQNKTKKRRKTKRKTNEFELKPKWEKESNQSLMWFINNYIPHIVMLMITHTTHPYQAL